MGHFTGKFSMLKTRREPLEKRWVNYRMGEIRYVNVGL
jgi:hypothetical protein